jgi:hypothetical protein
LQASLPDRYLPVNDPTMTAGQKQWALHQGMDFAHQYARRLGLDPLTIPTLVCIRNPYDHVLSGYKYLADRPAGTVPDMEPDFPSYVHNMYQKLNPRQKKTLEQAPFGLHSKYVLVGGMRPGNVTVARTESLSEEIPRFIREKLGARPVHTIARDNASSDGGHDQYYGRKEEEIVYRLYKQLFDTGIYSRFEGLSF